MKTRAFFFGRLLLPAAALISFSGSAQATAYYWDGNGATAGTGGTGAWDAASALWHSLSDTGTLGTYGNAAADTAVFGGTAGTVTLASTENANRLTFLTSGYTIAGGTLTLSSTTPTIDTGANSATISSVLAGTAGLTKIGSGALTLTGTNTYTGNTTISAGTVALDFSASGAPSANIINSASVLKLGGGKLQVIGASGGSTQTFASTSFTAATGGQNVIAAAPVSGTVPTVALGTLSGTQGALVRFDGAAYNSAASSGTTLGGTTVAATANFTATTSTMTNGLISVNNGSLANANNTAMAYATVGLYDWAAISGATTGSAASTGTIVGASQNSGFYTTTSTLAATSSYGLNIDLTGSATMFGNSSGIAGAYSTIRFNAANATTLQVGRATGNSVVGALLVTPNVGANNTTIAVNNSANTVVLQASRSTNAATGLTVWQNNTQGELIVNAVYANGSSSAATASYTQGGAGTVLLSAVNTYSGQTYLDGGTTVIAANSGLGAIATGAAVNINGGSLFGNATFALDNAGANKRGVALNGAGGTLAASASNTMTVSGVVSGAGNLNIGTGTIAGTGAGTANATAVIGSGTVVLTGGNTYSGSTTVSAGTLNINGINALGGANYAGLTLNGGTLMYATAFSGNGSGDLTSIGTAGITLASGGGTVDTNGNSVTYSGTIGNGGSGSLTKAGTGTLTLSSANTHTGGSNISGGTLVAGNSSSLGGGALSIASGATLSSGDLSVGAVTLSGGANILLNGVANQITSSGAVAISGSSNVLTLGGSAGVSGTTYNLLSGTSLSASGISLTGSAVGGSTVTLGSSSTVGRTNYAFSATDTALQLAVTGGAFNLTWNGGSSNWNATDAIGQKDGAGSDIAFYAGDNMTIATGDSITVDGGGVTAGNLAVTNDSGTAALSGGALTAVSLSKSGAGTLNLNTTTTLTNSATVSAGTLAFGASGSLAGATIIDVSGGTLDIGTTSQSLANVSLSGGSITGSTGVLTATGSALAAKKGDVSAILAGSVGLNKTTADTVTLSGANTYSGTTTVNAGTLALTGDGSLGTSTLTVSGGTADLGAKSITNTLGALTGGGTISNGTITNNGGNFSLQNGTVSAVLNGTSGLNKTSANTVVLSGTNTYSGGTNVTEGTLQLANASALGSTSAALGVNGGTLDLNGNSAAVGALTGSGGTINNGMSGLAVLTASSGSYSGAIANGLGTVALVKNGNGTLTLSGVSTYSGGTALNAGTLVLNNGAGAGTGTITAANGTTVSQTVASNIGNAVTLTGAGASVTMTSNQASSGYTSNITGSADQTLVILNNGNNVNFNGTTKQFANFAGTVSIQAGSSLVDRSSSTTWTNGGDGTLFNVNGSISSRNGGAWALGGLTGSGTLSMGTAGSSGIGLNYTIGARNDASNTFSGVIQNGDTATGKIVSVTKVGTGTQVFSGTNTYSGLTSVTEGTLALGAAGSINNSSGVYLGTGGGTFDVSAKSGGYTVASLTGSGNVIGSLAVSTSLAIGNSPGTANFSSDLTLGAGSTYYYELIGGTTGLGSADLGNVAGNLDLGSATLNLSQYGAGVYTANDKFTLFSYSGTLAGTFSGLANNSTFTGAGGDWLINYYDTSAGTNGGTQSNFVTITAVPEPDAAMLVGGLGVLALLRRRRA